MIYFVEGIPGGGKSSYSRKIYTQIKNQQKTEYFKEEYYNPIDLLRQAMMKREEYDTFLDKLAKCCNSQDYVLIKEQLLNTVSETDELIFVPFMHIQTSSIDAKRLLYSIYDYEVDDGKIECGDYCNIVFKRLSFFLENCEKESSYIFEGALLHNPLISLLGFYEIYKDDIICFYKKIYNVLRNYQYKIILLDPVNIENTIDKTIANRKNEKGFSWEKGFEVWFQKTLNFKELSGRSGIIELAKMLYHYEELLVNTIPFNYEIIERQMR